MSDQTEVKPSSAALGDEQQGAPQTNFERLIAHLDKDSLAAKLVSAYAAADGGAEARAIKDVMTDRLNELKRGNDQSEDQ